MASKKEKGKGTKKYGRHNRAASNANQSYRSAKNKRLAIEREARRQAEAKATPRVSQRDCRRAFAPDDKPATPVVIPAPVLVSVASPTLAGALRVALYRGGVKNVTVHERKAA